MADLSHSLKNTPLPAQKFIISLISLHFCSHLHVYSDLFRDVCMSEWVSSQKFIFVGSGREVCR